MQDLKDGKGNTLGVEAVGVLSINQNTGKKGVLILPWSGNTYKYSKIKIGFYGSFYEDQNGIRYTPLAIVHTHPENDIGPSCDGPMCAATRVSACEQGQWTSMNSLRDTALPTASDISEM